MKVVSTWKQFLVLNSIKTRFMKTEDFEKCTLLHILEILIRYNPLIFICVENLFKFCICNFYYSTQAFTTQALHILQESIVKAYQSRFRNQMTIFLSRSEPSKQ